MTESRAQDVCSDFGMSGIPAIADYPSSLSKLVDLKLGSQAKPSYWPKSIIGCGNSEDHQRKLFRVALEGIRVELDEQDLIRRHQRGEAKADADHV